MLTADDGCTCSVLLILSLSACQFQYSYMRTLKCMFTLIASDINSIIAKSLLSVGKLPKGVVIWQTLQQQ